MSSTWKTTKLKAFTVKIGSGVTPRGGSAVYKKSGIPLIRSQNVLHNRLNLSNVAFIDSKQHKKMKSSEVYPNDVLLNITGASIGRCCVVPLDIDQANVNQHVCIIRLNNKFNSNFLSSFLNSWYGQKQIISYQSGGSREGLNFVQIGNLLIPNLKLPEQKAIADILSTWDSVIEKTERLITEKEKRFKWLLNELITKNDEKESWKKVTLGEVCSIKKGKGLSKENISNNGANKCILYGELYTVYPQVISKIISRTNNMGGEMSRVGDILIPGSTTTSGIDLANATALLEDNVLLGGDINILRSKKKNSYDPIFLAYYLTYIKKYEIASHAQGITIVHLYGRDIIKLNLSLPPLTVQIKIKDILIHSHEEIDYLNNIISKYKTQKNGLMQKLLTGKWRVKVK